MKKVRDGMNSNMVAPTRHPGLHLSKRYLPPLAVLIAAVSLLGPSGNFVIFFEP